VLKVCVSPPHDAGEENTMFEKNTRTDRTDLGRITTLALLMLLVLVFYFPLGCSVAATGAATSSLQKEQAAESTGIVSAQFFGMVVKNPAVQPAVATGSRRLWDSGVSWAALEPAAGTFNWSTLDGEVAAAEQAGVQVTLTLGLTPTWASAQPGILSSYGAGATAMPANISDWDAYVSAVAARYRGRISAYEVWNAPEDTIYWSGAPAQMGADLAALAAHTAAAVHAADASATVVSPALSPSGLTAFLAAGGGSSVDAIGTSLVASGQAPERMTAAVQAIRAALAGTAADGKPLWNDQGSWVLPQGGLSPETQAAYVARALILNAGYAVQRMHWYAWDENRAGSLALTDAEAQPTSAATAYSIVEGWVAGSQMNGCAATAGGVWTCQIVRDGKTGWIVWSTTGSVSSRSLGAATLTDLHGNTTAVATDGSVGVSGSPVLLQ